MFFRGVYPRLSSEEERQLFEELVRVDVAGRQALLEKLVLSYLPLVRMVARKFSGYRDLDDLVQLGVCKLLEVAGSFDLTRGIRFATYVYRPVYNIMHDYVCRPRLAVSWSDQRSHWHGPDCRLLARESLAASRWRVAKTWRLLRSLPIASFHRRIFWLRYRISNDAVSRRPLADIASCLSLPAQDLKHICCRIWPKLAASGGIPNQRAWWIERYRIVRLEEFLAGEAEVE